MEEAQRGMENHRRGKGGAGKVDQYAVELSNCPYAQTLTSLVVSPTNIQQVAISRDTACRRMVRSLFLWVNKRRRLWYLEFWTRANSWPVPIFIFAPAAEHWTRRTAGALSLSILE